MGGWLQRLLARVGMDVSEGIAGIGRVLFLFREVAKWLARELKWVAREKLLHKTLRERWNWLFREKHPDLRTLVQQIHFVGVQSLPVVLTTGAFTGMVLAYSSYFEFKRLGVESWVGPLVSKGLTQQLAPTLVGLMLAGRVGCAMAAELGYMAVSEQLDALKTMGTNPVRYLVLPRVLAFTAMSPLLTAFAMLIGITGGIGLCVVGLGAEWHYIWTKTQDFMVSYDYFQGLSKSVFFGLTTALICCYKGMNARGGAEGVGKATTEANVASCITILVVNLFLTMILGLWAPR
ncbi:MAG: ABC transporter permease [Planctomycetota bacterium]